MGAQKQVEKDAVFWSVLNSAIQLDIKQGHLKWTISELSRKSGVTRSLIYYYFGRSKIDILHEAIKIIGEEFAGVTQQRVEMWKKGELAKSLMLTRRIYDKSPYLSVFVLEHRLKNNSISDAILDIENSFKKKLKIFFPKVDEVNLQAIYIFYWGLCFAPDVSDASIVAAISMIKKHMI